MLVTAFACAPVHARERVAVLNWGLTQTLTALGVDPVAVANPAGYRKWVAQPALPGTAVDVGRRIEPNLDVLAAAEPDLILMSGYPNRARDRMETIAATRTLSIFRPDSDALARSRKVAADLADRLERQRELQRLDQRLERAIARLRARTQRGESVYVVRFRDAGHVQVFGGGGLFGGILRRAGLVNAWRGETNYWGFGIAPLARLDAGADHLVLVEPIPQPVERMMRDSAIWGALPAVRAGRVHRLAPIWSFGGMPSAIQFANRLAAAIDAPD
jgi:iron complex transport system substrate-binding protein